MSSRLFMEVRERLGLAYYIKVDIDANPDTGFLVARAGVENSNAEKAILAILKEYRKIAQKRVPEAELKKAKDYINGKMALVLEPSDALASFYVGQELLQKEVLTPKEIYDRINKVSSKDVLQVARDIFKPKNLNLALVGPLQNKDKFKKLLKL